ncbi:MAG: nuclease SbcCD subunit D [Chloroflexi bacterium]|nr:nuclease SbcCD subunit D [Chloroflexota bacterium]
MKIIHFSDLHIGYTRYSKGIDLETGLDNRIVDFLNTFDELVNYALQENVDLVIFAGDAYKDRNPSQTHQKEFAKRLLKLTKANISVALIVGNHDMPGNKGRATALDIFPTMNLDNITVIDKLQLYELNTKSGNPIQILGMPWIRKGSLISRLSNIKKDITIEDLNKQIIQTLDNSLEKELAKVNKSIPCIFSGHLTVMEAKTSTETLMSIGADYMFPAQFFARPEFEYVALGHVHKDQILIESPPVIYSGSLERIDFGEKDDIKGFYVIEIELEKSQGNRLVSYKKIQVSARNFKEYIINIPKDTEFPVNIIEKELNSNEIKDSIARITIESTREHYESINDPKIKSILSKAKYLVSTELQLISEKKINDIQISENLGIVDSFEKYLENFKEINDQKRKRLLDFGKEIINEYENENE